MKKILLLFFAASFFCQHVSAQTSLLRIRANGATIPVTGEPDWTGVSGTAAQSGSIGSINYTVTAGMQASFPIVGRDANLPAYVPDAIFQNERWDNTGGDEMLWTFTLPNDTYIVRLFMMNGWPGSSATGQRIFDIRIEGILVDDDLDLSALFGHQIGGMREYTVTLSDGTLDILFEHGAANNPLINGIEILEPDNPAPISLANFTAKPHSNQSVMLDWITSSEENNEYFSIEHSNDGRNFESIDMVEGALNSTVMQYYSYEHKEADEGNNYYRLRQVDTDGTFSFSPIEVVRLAGDTEIKVLPTLAENVVTISVADALDSDVDVEIYDVLGRLVLAQTLGRGELQVEVPVSDLQQGHYFVRINNGTKSRVARFIKR